jgi:hypothetical protein
MVMTPQVRKLALTAHVTASVGWMGALMVFLTHAIVSVANQDPTIVRAACLAMGVTAWLVILPLSVTSLVTGLVQALGTAWGLLRHYWIWAKLLLTLVATGVLLLKLAPIQVLAEAAANTTFSPADLFQARVSLLLHAGGGLLVLSAIVALAIYKPAGLTRYGLRKACVEDGVAGAPPRWWKVFRTSIIGLALLLVLMTIFGGHGPGMHMSGG